MPAFFPTNPKDPVRTKMERDAWFADIEKQKKKDRQETRRFIVTCCISSVAAIAAVAAVMIQLLKP